VLPPFLPARGHAFIHFFFSDYALRTSKAKAGLWRNILRDRTACYLSLVTNYYGNEQLQYCNITYTIGVWRKAPRKTNTPKSRLSHPNIIPYQHSALSLTHKKCEVTVLFNLRMLQFRTFWWVGLHDQTLYMHSIFF